MDHLSLATLGLFVAKTAVVLIVLVVAFRLLGKRQTGQMNHADDGLFPRQKHGGGDAALAGAVEERR